MRLIIRNKKLNFFSHLAFFVFSFYLSFIIFLGGFLGYVSAKYIARRATKGTKINKGYLRLAILKFKNYNFHFHHWIQGLAALFLYIYFSQNDNRFIIGFMSGVIAEDFLCDTNFYKVFGKEKKEE